MKRTKQVYGVFIGTKWGVTTSRKEALKALDDSAGGFVRSIPWAAYRAGSAWDAPTFIAISDLVKLAY